MHRTRHFLLPLSVLGLLLFQLLHTSCAESTHPPPPATVVRQQVNDAGRQQVNAAAKPLAKVPATPPPDATLATVVAPQPASSPPSAPIAAPAAVVERPTQTWWQALLYDVTFKLLVPIFVPVLAALLFVLMRKMGVKIELETLEKLGENAKNYSEHKAKTWLNEYGHKSSGAQKEDWAWELVESIDSKLKGRQKARKKLRAIILAKLGEAEQRASLFAVEPTESKPPPPPVPIRGAK